MTKPLPGIKAPKKLIEVALPLDDINDASAREKSIRHGHPSTLHLWWARRPLAAARAVLFAQLVNDPGGERGWMKGKSKEEADRERERLFDIIRDLVKWENTTNEEVLERAREEIRKSWRETCEMNKGLPGFDPETLPAFHDPFAGGGSIPLEAQRLGLEAHASDLNPVAVLINKAMIEIPPKFAGRAPVAPLPAEERQEEMPREWRGAQGLAEDVRRSGRWMRDEAYKRIGHLYPDIEITKDMTKGRPDLKPYVGRRLTVIAWLWARTVKSPNPAFSHVDVPLVSSFLLSTKAGKEAWVKPVIDGDAYRFDVKVGEPPDEAKTGTKLSQGAFRCLISDTPFKYAYIDDEANAGRMGSRLLAIVAEGDRGRIYLSPTTEVEDLARSARPDWKPETPCRGTFASNAQGRRYGFNVFGDYFTSRQLVALNTFSDLVQEARTRVIADAIAAGLLDDGIGLEAGGTGATAYGDAVAVYLGFSVIKATNYWSSLCSWHSGRDTVTSTFGRQAIPMVWDYAEANPLSSSSGNFSSGFQQATKLLNAVWPGTTGTADQHDAMTQSVSYRKIISTDPPYYDNIGYADLSDFFYVWHRRTMHTVFPSMFKTIGTPKESELIASPYRQGSKARAEQFFLSGMETAFTRIAQQFHPAFPLTIYYAFKQADTSENDTASTGWETFLEAVIRAGLSITGTWPMRTELIGNLKKQVNALASSIILVCRKRESIHQQISRRDFQRLLREDMPQALRTMIGGSSGRSPIAPVDLAQASIGPGMAIFSRYDAVLNQDGSSMRVHDALVLINREISEYLNPDAGHYDEDTRFCTQWFEQYGWKSGPFGEAQVLATAKGTTVAGVVDAGVLHAKGGRVTLIRWDKYPNNWDPARDTHTPAWEALHHLIRLLDGKGEDAAGTLLAAMPERGEKVRQLAYHLYTICDRNKWAEDARPYNDLVTAWPGIVSVSTSSAVDAEQTEMEL